MSDADLKTVAMIEAPVSNYYGGPGLFVYADGTACFGVENYDGWPDHPPHGMKVSRSFALAFIREFGEKTDDAKAAMAVLRKGSDQP